MAKKDTGGTLSAVIIVDPKELGGEVTIVLDGGGKFAVRGALARGLKEAVNRDRDYVPDLYADGVV